MKKPVLLIMIALALGFIGCDHGTTNNAVSAFDAAEVVTIENGQLLFYNVNKQSAKLYTAETDSVINLLFDCDNHLYYSVAKNQKLTLKMLDLNVKDPQPKACGSWNLTLQDVTDYMMGDLSALYFSPDQKQVRIEHHFGEEFDFLSTVRCYDIATGKMSDVSMEDLMHEHMTNNRLNGERFICDNHILYHILPDGNKVALSDNIDYKKHFDSGDEMFDMEFDASRVDPTGQKLIFDAVVQCGEGWGFYCLANMDGSDQQLLEGSSIWFQLPEWLDNGSLVFVGVEPRAMDDPEYNEWNTTKPCIKMMATDGTTKIIGHGGFFAVKPFGPKPEAQETPEFINPEGSDMVILENGKITLYNSSTNQFIPLEQEKDSVVNAAFIFDDDLYYTVAIGDELYLKYFYLWAYNFNPIYRTDWELKIEDCVSQTYGETAHLMCYPSLFRIGLPFDFNWEFYSFANTRFFDLSNDQKWDGWKEDEGTDNTDEEFLKWDDDMAHFSNISNNYYYNDNGRFVCVSDKINFKNYASDPSYYEDPEFGFLSIDPTNKNVCYTAIIEFGDLGHGPLCFASLDGKVQVAFEDTDAADLNYGWLKDGSLVFAGKDGDNQPCIKRVTPDGKVSIFSKAESFVTLH